MTWFVAQVNRNKFLADRRVRRQRFVARRQGSAARDLVATEGGMARITVVGEYPEFVETISVTLGGIAAHEIAGLDGDHATLQQVLASAPQLLIVDLRTQGDDLMGWDMLQLARSSPALRDVPVIVCFANMPRLRARANEFARIGNVWALAKPFSAEAVSGMVGRALIGR